MNRGHAGARAAASLLFSLGLLTRPSASRAQDAVAPPAVSVAPVGCADLDVDETERLLRVELAVVAARAERPRAPSVTVACSNSTLHIEITDPLTKAARSLDLPAPERAPGRERTVALAASQLFLSSWLEMIVEERPATPEPPPARAVVTQKPAATPARAQPESPRYELWLGAGAKARDLSQPFANAGAEVLAVRALTPRWLLGARVAGELGTIQRSSGSIHSVAVAAGALGGLRLGSGAWGFDAAASFGVCVLHGSGTPGQASTLGSSATGAAAELALLTGPTLKLSPFRFELAAEAGLVEPAVTLRVAHDAAARLSGVWLGGALLVGFEFGS